MHKDTVDRIAAMAVFLLLLAVGTAKADWRMYPYVVTLESDEPIPEMDDSTFYRVARPVIFPVNKYHIQPNSAFYHELMFAVIPEMNAGGYRLERIALRGAASPEGPLRWNTFLGEHRRKALYELIDGNMHLPSCDECITTVDMPEDYRYLVYMMQQAGDPDCARVKEIVNQWMDVDVVTLKSRLMSVDGRRLWDRLLRDYYPQLRAARVVLYFRRPAPAVVPPPPPPAYSVDVPTPQLEGIDFPVVMPRRHMLAISSNLLYDAFYMPHYGWAPTLNLALEYYPRRGHYTYLASFTFPYYHRWSVHKFYQIRDYHLELRRYFRPGFWHTGAFVAAYVNANVYGIGFSETKGWEGEGAGGALKAGYVWRLGGSGRWRLELSAAFGVYYTRYDPYVWGNPKTGMVDGLYYYDYTGSVADFHRRNYQRIWYGPTEVGLHLRYDMLFWRTQKKGVGLK